MSGHTRLEQGDLGDAPNNLPSIVSSFVGRSVELGELRALVRSERLVTLTGAGGCGKSRLALELGGREAGRFRDGVTWVDLARVTNGSFVASAMLRAMGMREESATWSDHPALSTLTRQLTRCHALIILDNCEHLLDVTAGVVASLLECSPELVVVATSREPLGLRGEACWRAPSLRASEAAQLFVERAAHVRPGFSPNALEIEAVRLICARLDGIALAIELAAGRIRMMSPATILEGLNDRFRLLTGGARTAVSRQQTLEASVAWSYYLLDDADRAVLRRLSTFCSAFAIEAAEAVCSFGDVERYAVLDVISRLVDKSLVQVDSTSDPHRFRLLETIRMYARARLAEAGEADEAARRHLDYHLGFAERAAPELFQADGSIWLDRLDVMYDDLHAAFSWADTSGDVEAMQRLAVALTLFFELRCHLTDGARWFDQALAAPGRPSSLRARAMWGSAHVAVYRDDFAPATLQADEATAMAEAVGDRWALARSLNTAGYARMYFEPAAARKMLEASIAVGRDNGDAWSVADGLKLLTVAWQVHDDHDHALVVAAELAAEAARLGNDFFAAWCHCCHGWAALRGGRLDAARRGFAESLELCARVGEPATAGVALSLLAEVDALTGRCDAAETSLRRYLRSATATGGSLGVPFAVTALAGVRLGHGDATTAARILDDMLVPVRQLGSKVRLSWALSLRGACAAELGDTAAAEQMLAEARAAADELGNPWLSSLARHHLGRLAGRLGDHSRAASLHHEALALRASGAFLVDIADTLEELSSAAFAQSAPPEASRLLAAADAIRASIGCVLNTARRTEHDARLAALAESTSIRDLQQWQKEGAAMSPAEAVAYATRRRGERRRPSHGWDALTPAELDVVRCVAAGMTTPNIAHKLFISTNTVKTHLAHAFTKLALSSRSELAAEAVRHGL